MLITWLCWFNWLLKVTVRLAAALGVLLPAKTLFPFSKAPQRRLHMSMFWKQDFTLDGGGIKPVNPTVQAKLRKAKAQINHNNHKRDQRSR